jgi:hypothetical protein
MALRILKGREVVLEMKDSIRIIPGALGKLAKDFKVETQKDHFPHYFFYGDLKSTLNYITYLLLPLLLILSLAIEILVWIPPSHSEPRIDRARLRLEIGLCITSSILLSLSFNSF